MTSLVLDVFKALRFFVETIPRIGKNGKQAQLALGGVLPSLARTACMSAQVSRFLPGDLSR